MFWSAWRGGSCGAEGWIPTFPRSLAFVPQALSSLESVITSFPFFYRPKGLRLGEAWHFHPPERYYKRIAREVGAVMGAWGCGRAGSGRGAGTGHSLCALDLVFAPPCAADQSVAAERGERGLQLVPQLPPRGNRASRRGRRCPGAQRPLPPGRPLPCAQLLPRSPRNCEPHPSPEPAARTLCVPLGSSLHWPACWLPGFGPGSGPILAPPTQLNPAFIDPDPAPLPGFRVSPISGPTSGWSGPTEALSLFCQPVTRPRSTQRVPPPSGHNPPRPGPTLPGLLGYPPTPRPIQL